MLDIVLAVLLIVQPVFAFDQAAAGQTTSDQAKAAPAFQLKDLQGRRIRLSDYKGKVVLINFWATWCSPCQAEMPELVKLQREYASRGLQVISITCPPERKEQVRRVVRKFRLNYPVLFGTREMTRLYEAEDVLPVTIIVDRDGRVHGRILGILEPEEFQEKILPLL